VPRQLRRSCQNRPVRRCAERVASGSTTPAQRLVPVGARQAAGRYARRAPSRGGPSVRYAVPKATTRFLRAGQGRREVAFEPWKAPKRRPSESHRIKAARVRLSSEKLGIRRPARMSMIMSRQFAIRYNLSRAQLAAIQEGSVDEASSLCRLLLGPVLL